MIINKVGQEHDFTVDEMGVKVVQRPGSASLEIITAAKKGTFTHYCSVPGRREAGMFVTLILD